MDFLAKIFAFSKIYGMNKTTFESNSRIAKGLINKWQGGTTPGMRSLKKVAEFMGISVNELLDDKISYTGPTLVPNDQNFIASIWKTTPGNVSVPTIVSEHMPEYADADVHIIQGLNEVPDSAVVLEWENLADHVDKSSDYFYVKIADMDMFPHILPGDVVRVSRSFQDISHEIAIVLAGEDLVCRRIIPQENGFVLQPYNPECTAEYYSRSRIEQLPLEIVGVITAIHRKISPRS